MHHTCHVSRLGRLAALALVLGSSSAFAAGMFVPDNGASVLARAGNDIPVLDSAYALQFNPAGLPFSNGLDVHVDVMMLNWGETFQPAGSNVVASNNGGLTIAPMVMASYRLPGALRQLAFGLGVWGPPGVINYKFIDPRQAADPTDGTATADATPTRYNNINQTTIVIFPSVGIGWRPIPQFSIGITGQYVYSSIGLATSLVGQPQSLGGTTEPAGNTGQDILATIDVKSKARYSFMAGVMAQPIPDLTISLSGHPTILLDHVGTLKIDVGSDLKDIAKITPDTPSAVLRIQLPAEIRGGAAYKWQRLTAALEVVWEKASDNKQFFLTTDAKASLLNSPPSGIPPVAIVNNWQDSVSTRLNVGYDFLRPADKGFLLQGNLGGVFENNAIPSGFQNLPYVTGNMAGVAGGVTFTWKGFGATLAGIFLIPQSFTVTDSKVEKPVPLKGANDPIEYIGNGQYSTNIWMLGFGLSYHGLDEQT